MSILQTRSPRRSIFDSVAKDFKDVAVYTLTGGQGVYIPGGAWHWAVNTTRCVSVNASVCALDATLAAVEADVNWYLTDDSAGQDVASFGVGYAHVLTRALLASIEADGSLEDLRRWVAVVEAIPPTKFCTAITVAWKRACNKRLKAAIRNLTG